jgi:hypothetical protein
MAEKTRHEEGKGEESKTPRSSSKSEPNDVNEQLVSAYNKYTRGIYDDSLSGCMQQKEHYAAYAKAGQQAELETTRRATEAHRNYVKAAQEAAQKENPQEALAEAYRNYAETLQGLHQDSARQSQEAYQELAKKASEARTHNQQQARKHYVDYLKHVQSAWSSVDMDSLVP